MAGKSSDMRRERGVNETGRMRMSESGRMWLILCESAVYRVKTRCDGNRKRCLCFVSVSDTIWFTCVCKRTLVLLASIVGLVVCIDFVAIYRFCHLFS
jgi:hypothetical protein